MISDQLPFKDHTLEQGGNLQTLKSITGLEWKAQTTESPPNQTDDKLLSATTAGKKHVWH